MTAKLIFIFAVAVEVLVGAAFAEDAGRSPSEVDTILTGGWKFSKDPTHTLAAEGIDFDDSAWETVRVPHDWAISGPFNPKEHGGSGKLPWKGVGWYRRSLTLDAADAGKSVFLDFDGVMASPKVYVNGQTRRRS